MARKRKSASELAAFARALRQARSCSGHTQADVADAVGVTEIMYARYETARCWPSIRTFARLCQTFGCSADALLGTTKLDPSTLKQPAEPAELRRLLRHLRNLHPHSIKLVQSMVEAVEKEQHMMKKGKK